MDSNSSATKGRSWPDGWSVAWALCGLAACVPEGRLSDVSAAQRMGDAEILGPIDAESPPRVDQPSSKDAAPTPPEPSFDSAFVLLDWTMSPLPGGATAPVDMKLGLTLATTSTVPIAVFTSFVKPAGWPFGAPLLDFTLHSAPGPREWSSASATHAASRHFFIRTYRGEGGQGRPPPRPPPLPLMAGAHDVLLDSAPVRFDMEACFLPRQWLGRARGRGLAAEDVPYGAAVLVVQSRCSELEGATSLWGRWLLVFPRPGKYLLKLRYDEYAKGSVGSYDAVPRSGNLSATSPIHEISAP